MIDQESKLFNLVTNFALIKMGDFLEGFSELFGDISESLYKEFSKVEPGKVKEIITSKMSKNIIEEILDLKKQIYDSYSEQKEMLLEQFGGESAIELIDLVDQYNFALPKLYEDIDENDIAGYMFLLEQNDQNIIQLIEKVEEIGNNGMSGEDSMPDPNEEFWNAFEGVKKIEVYSDSKLIKTIRDSDNIFVIVAAIRAQLKQIDPTATEYQYSCKIITEEEKEIEAAFNESSFVVLDRELEIPEEVSWLFNMLTG